MKRILQAASAMKRSVIAWAVFSAFGLLGMGVLGLGLYYAVYPVLGPHYGDPNRWSGDWVWPAMIWTGLLWPLSFLLAGALHGRLQRRGAAPWLRRLAYALVLWLGALLVWWLALLGRGPA